MTKKIGVVGSMINTSDYLLFKCRGNVTDIKTKEEQ